MDLLTLINDLVTNNSWIHSIVNPIVAEDYGVVNDVHTKKHSAVIFYKDLAGVLQPAGRIEFLVETDTSVDPNVETAMIVQSTLDKYNPNIEPPKSFVQIMQEQRDLLISVKQVFGITQIKIDNVGEVAIVEAIHPHPQNILFPNSNQREPNIYIKYRAALDNNRAIQFWPETAADKTNRDAWLADMMAAGIDPLNPAASWGTGS